MMSDVHYNKMHNPNAVIQDKIHTKIMKISRIPAGSFLLKSLLFCDIVPMGKKLHEITTSDEMLNYCFHIML